MNDPEKYPHLLEEFKKAFDIIIVGDGSYMGVIYLLKKLFNQDMNEKDLEIL